MDAIVATQISKVFRLTENPSQSVKERLIRLGRTRHRNFTALEKLDLTVSTGETLGILGHNGSGKSTLQKCISGILKPTTGEIRLRGRLASLLELGAGFHPELTGRENVFINASFLGIGRREIARRFDDIVEFAELQEFIDEPVKHYSSGMYVRLGFAVAINLDPDILLVDEVLAVGDEVFQRKCLDRVRQLQKEGRTIVVVTHAADVVRQVCQRAIVLHHGKMVANGSPGESIRIFREHLHGTLVAPVESTDVDSDVRIVDIHVRHGHDSSRKFLLPGEPLTLDVTFIAGRPMNDPTLSVSMVSVDGQTIYAEDFDLLQRGIGALNGKASIRVEFAGVPLLDGSYTVSARLIDRGDSGLVASREDQDEFSILNPGTAQGLVALIVRSVSLVNA